MPTSTLASQPVGPAAVWCGRIAEAATVDELNAVSARAAAAGQWSRELIAARQRRCEDLRRLGRISPPMTPAELRQELAAAYGGDDPVPAAFKIMTQALFAIIDALGLLSLDGPPGPAHYVEILTICAHEGGPEQRLSDGFAQAAHMLTQELADLGVVEPPPWWEQANAGAQRKSQLVGAGT
jgi:hypothetical protein